MKFLKSVFVFSFLSLGLHSTSVFAQGCEPGNCPTPATCPGGQCELSQDPDCQKKCEKDYLKEATQVRCHEVRTFKFEAEASGPIYISVEKNSNGEYQANFQQGWNRRAVKDSKVQPLSQTFIRQEEQDLGMIGFQKVNILAVDFSIESETEEVGCLSSGCVIFDVKKMNYLMLCEVSE